MVKVTKSILVIARWDADNGREYQHREDPAVCLTCEGRPAYSQACEQAGHATQQLKHVEVTQRAPDEEKQLRAFYGLIDRRLHAIGFGLGKGVYLVGEDAPLQESFDALERQMRELNSKFAVCRARFEPVVIDIQPGATRQRTLENLQAAAERGVRELLEALQRADVDGIRKAIYKAKNISRVLDEEGRRDVGALTAFATSLVKRLKEATDEGARSLEYVEEESRLGATRFANILADRARAEATEAVAGIAHEIEAARQAVTTTAVEPTPSEVTVARQGTLPFAQEG